MAFESTTPAATPSPGASAQWRIQVRTALIVTAVLAIGLFAAQWQFAAVGSNARGHTIVVWFGEWMAYGLSLYTILYFSRRVPPGVAPVLAALLIAAGVNTQAYVAASEDRAVHASLARALPLYTLIESSAAVSDQEVRDAGVGLLEPLLLAQAANARELTALEAAYRQETAVLGLDQMLMPASLAAPERRARTRARIQQWQQATAAYQAQFAAAAARGRQRIAAAHAQMPAALGESAIRGYDQSIARLSTYIEGMEASAKEFGQGILAILDLLDANPRAYALDPRPPQRLVFQDPATLDEYNRRTAVILAVGQRTAQARKDRDRAESAQALQMTDLLKR